MVDTDASSVTFIDDPWIESQQSLASTLKLPESPRIQESKQSPASSKYSKPPKSEEHPLDKHPTGWTFALIIISCWSCLFLVALDRTIVATAIPAITDEFDSSDDILWYSGAYLITSCATQLLWGRIYTFYDTKYVTFLAVVLFEVGSAVCGAAPSSIALILGRAIAGVGSAALFTGMTVIVVAIMPLRKRPFYMALSGMVFGFASVLGPLLGGAFTEHVSWRWCFWINLPIGSVSIALLAFVLNVEPPNRQQASVPDQIRRLDPPGLLCLVPSVVSLLLALQWGGVRFAWDSGKSVALIMLSAFLIIAFWFVQWLQKENATIRLRIIGQRSVAVAAAFATLSGGAMVTMIYWLAFWFQTVKETGALQSGIRTLPLVVAWPVASLACGSLVTKIGYYQPPMYLSCILLSVGAGLITTFDRYSKAAQWIGYQVIFGLGLGVGMQQASLATQNSLSRADTPVGISLMFFCQSLGGAVVNAIAQASFESRLQFRLVAVAGIEPSAFTSIGATDLRHLVAANELGKLLDVYKDALKGPFYVALGACVLLILPTLAVEWKKLPQKAPPRPVAQPSPSEDLTKFARDGKAFHELQEIGTTKYVTVLERRDNNV